MGWILAIIVGAVIGYLASLIMKTDRSMGAIANIIVGIVGAAFGRYIFSNVLGIGSASSAGSFSLLGIVWGVVGAVILIAILKLFNLMGTAR